jgi:hypothetical protein
MSRSRTQSSSETHRHSNDRLEVKHPTEGHWAINSPIGVGRLGFLPFAVSERDAFALQAILRGLEEGEAGCGGPAARGSREGSRSSLAGDLRLASRFSQRHGILVIVFPETAPSRKVFEQLGLGDCLFIGVDELRRKIDQDPALRTPVHHSAEDSWRADAGSRTLAGPTIGTRASGASHSTESAWQPGVDEHERLELRQQIAALQTRPGSEALQLQNLEYELEKVRGSLGWFVLERAARVRNWLVPTGSRLHSLRRLGTKFLKAWIEHGGRVAFLKARRKLVMVQTRRRLARFRLLTQGGGDRLARKEIAAHTATVDVVICVHNALEDVRLCLQSVKEWSNDPCLIILVDDGSDLETAEFLRDFVRREGARLIRNDVARGYTFAANQGLRCSTAELVVLLNSDTIVTPGWLDRLVACAQSDSRIGLVGPLSNAASWQSIPDLTDPDGDWAENTLPPGLPPHEMGRLVGLFSGRIYPRLPFLNGFCLMVRRQVLDQVGLFDEATFGQG